jgi:hypothetical protein
MLAELKANTSRVRTLLNNQNNAKGEARNNRGRLVQAGMIRNNYLTSPIHVEKEARRVMHKAVKAWALKRLYEPNHGIQAVKLKLEYLPKMEGPKLARYLRSHALARRRQLNH